MQIYARDVSGAQAFGRRGDRARALRENRVEGLMTETKSELVQSDWELVQLD